MTGEELDGAHVDPRRPVGFGPANSAAPAALLSRGQRSALLWGFALYAVLSCSTFLLDIFETFDELEYLSPFIGADFHGRRLPLYPTLVVGLGHLLEDSSLAGQLISKVCVLGTGLILFRLLARLFGTFAACCATLLFGVLPVTVLQSSTVHPFGLYGLLLVLCAERLVRSVETERTGPLGAAAAAAGLAALTRPEGFTLVGLVALWQFVVFLRRRTVSWGSWIGGALVMAAAVGWFLLHPGYAEQAVRFSKKGSLALTGEYLVGYLRAYPMLLGWLALPFCFLGLVPERTVPSERTLSSARRAYFGIALFVLASDLALLMTPSGWGPVYLYPTTLLLTGFFGCGLERVRRLRGGRRLAPLALVGCVALALGEAVPALVEYRKMLAPFHEACVFAAAHATRNSVQTSEVRHTQRWTDLRAVSYRRRLARPGALIVLEDFFFNQRGNNLEAELAWLVNERRAEVLFDQRGEYLPLLASTVITLDPPVSYTPRVLELRHTPQPTRAVVLRIP
ncbi:MAG: hypothetical protein HOP15_11220 [Planctomycetes bacterium]|nr:hypothetical protein [Planctomycetota bacterium]